MADEKLAEIWVYGDGTELIAQLGIER